MRWPKWSWPAVWGYALVATVCGVPFAFLQPVTVSGGSMSPALASGDVVLIRRGSAATKGDIALICEPGHSAVLHRVVGQGPGDTLRTRGDANPIDDFTPVSPDAVRGRVVAVLPAGIVLERWRAWRNRATLSAQSDSARR